MTSAINIFRLLEARPGLASLTVAILSHAAPLAADLARRPALLDGLIDASAFEPLPAVKFLERAMRGGESGQDYQDRLDHVRRVVGELRFALGRRSLRGGPIRSRWRVAMRASRKRQSASWRRRRSMNSSRRMAGCRVANW
ncbi:hypothetical protein GCM10020258_03110 [Sphingomonas yabuuchiae]